MTPHGLTHSEARLQAMHELEREYTATPPGGWPAAIEHRARWYMLTRAEQWLSHARVQLNDARIARQKGWADREKDALARFRHARGQWRKERNPVMPMAAE